MADQSLLKGLFSTENTGSESYIADPTIIADYFTDSLECSNISGKTNINLLDGEFD
jgi:hypothetical protein